MPEGQEEELLMTHEVVQHLRVDNTTVRRWIRNGVLDAVTLPYQGRRRGYRVRRSALDTILQSGLQKKGSMHV